MRVHIAPGLPVVLGDPTRLRQIFQNLIGNAIQHTDKPQTDIRVDFAEKGTAWKFSVADKGPGIEEGHFERIFKLFETLTPKGKTNSTGVGLALVRAWWSAAGAFGSSRVWARAAPFGSRGPRQPPLTHRSKGGSHD